MPAETPTLLFTDIEGSTALFERVGSIFSTALTLHHRVLRAAIESHGGRVVRDTGDGLIAGFDDAASGVAAAIAAQQALWTADWPVETGPLRVRMGLHRGAVEFRDGEYHGLTMHHAARVMSSAHGMQILCSSAVVQVLDGEVKDTRDLGLFRLKGILQPVRLYEVLHGGESYPEMPPPSVPAAFTHSLPVSSTRYFGREAEIAELVKLLAPQKARSATAGRLITLLGPGGTGKTRLATEVGRRLLPEYSHAVWFVPLADLRDPGLLLESIRDVLGISSDSDSPPLKQCADYLSSQHSLLILDNFEQLVPGAVDPIGKLLDAAPRLACLVTSRVRLEVGREQEYSVPPLRPPAAEGTPEELLSFPAVQLFVDRAQAARREFRITEANAADVAQLCRALEGMPLAIELAAARAAVLTPAQMLPRLERRLDFLTGKRRDSPERHRALRATIAWSYELLAPELQTAFARLSVFRGGWNLEAATAVAGGVEDGASDAVLDVVQELASCSLVIARELSGEMRYSMLETIREFAEEKLTACGECENSERGHHEYFFRLIARHQHGVAASAEFRVLEPEIDNLRAMLSRSGPIAERLRAAVSLYPFWLGRGQLKEGRTWLQRLRTEAAGDSTAPLAAAANALGILAWKAGDYATARNELTVALRHWEAVAIPENCAGILNNLGLLANAQGDYRSASEYYERSLEIYRKTKRVAELAVVLSNLGSNALGTGELDVAKAALEESLGILRESEETMATANALHNLGEVLVAMGDLSTARLRFAQCFELQRQMGSHHDESHSLLTLARIALKEGRLDAAASLRSAAVRVMKLSEEGPDDRTQKLLQEILQSAGSASDGAEPKSVQLVEILSPDGTWRI